MQPQAQQQYNPYLQRMENLQQFQQTLNPSPVQMQNQFPALGKMVESIDMVKATDIPMDGNMYYFPKADGSVIYGKRWMQNGQTSIELFQPIDKEKEIDDSLLEIKEIKERITELIIATGEIQAEIKGMKEVKEEKQSKKGA